MKELLLEIPSTSNSVFITGTNKFSYRYVRILKASMLFILDKSIRKSDFNYISFIRLVN